MNVPQACGKLHQMCVYLDGRIVVFGGYTEVTIEDENGDGSCQYVQNKLIWTFSLDNDCWSPYFIPAGQAFPPTRSNACAVVVCNDIYMFGGDAINRPGSTNALWKLYKTKPDEFSWKQVTFAKKASQPSPRKYCAIWEYDRKVWIFGGLAGPLDGYIGAHNSEVFAAVNDNEGWNNQLLCFDPSSGKWSLPGTTGTVPPHSRHVKAARSCEIVWVYDSSDTNLSILNLKLLAWSRVEVTGSVPPSLRHFTFTAATHSQIVLHGGYSRRSSPSRVLNDTTWFFDIESTSWEKYGGAQDHPRFRHSAVRADDSTVILGGASALVHTGEMPLCSDIFLVQLEPDSLQKLTLKSVFTHRDVLKNKLTRKFLAPDVYDDIMVMCKMSAES